MLYCQHSYPSSFINFLIDYFEKYHHHRHHHHDDDHHHHNHHHHPWLYNSLLSFSSPETSNGPGLTRCFSSHSVQTGWRRCSQLCPICSSIRLHCRNFSRYFTCADHLSIVNIIYFIMSASLISTYNSSFLTYRSYTSFIY